MGENIRVSENLFVLPLDIIATNGFVKKQQKTPRSEIDLAKQRRSDYHRRKEAGIYE